MRPLGPHQPSLIERNTVSHVPARARDRFCEWVEDETLPEDGTTPRELIGALWNCTDIAPSSVCSALDRSLGSTYAQLVRHLHLTAA